MGLSGRKNGIKLGSGGAKRAIDISVLCLGHLLIAYDTNISNIFGNVNIRIMNHPIRIIAV